MMLQDKITELFTYAWDKKLYNAAVEGFNVLYRDYHNALAKEDYHKATKIYAKAHRKFVNGCLAPYKFQAGSKTVLVKYLHTDTLHDEDSGKNIISLAVLTPQMLLTDSGFFSRNAYWLEGKKAKKDEDYFYKPYYYELDIYPDDLALFESLKEEFNRKDDGWYFAELHKTEATKSDEELTNLVIRNIKAKLCFSASPYTTDDVFMNLLNKVVDADLLKELRKLDTTPTTFDTNISPIMSNISGVIESQSYAVAYNVGQANCIYLYLYIQGKYGVNRVFFDVGRPFDEINSKPNPDLDASMPASTSLNNIMGCKPDVIIISHWHSDHFKAALSLGRCVYEESSNCMWIAPIPNKEAISKYRRVINFLLIRKKIRFVDIKTAYPTGCIYTKGGVTLYQGQGDETDLNASSLMLKVNKTLFAGDCLYSYWPGILQKDLFAKDKIEQIVAPHHGSYLNSDEISITSQAYCNGCKKAIVSVGTNIWSHPYQNHLDELKNMGFTTQTVFGSNNVQRDTLDL